MRSLCFIAIILLSACGKEPEKVVVPTAPKPYERGESFVLCKYGIYAILKDNDTDVSYVRPEESPQQHLFVWNYKSSVVREPSGRKHEVTCRVDRIEKKIDLFEIDGVKIM